MRIAVTAFHAIRVSQWYFYRICSKHGEIIEEIRQGSVQKYSQKKILTLARI